MFFQVCTIVQVFHRFYKIHNHKPSIFMAYDSTPNTYLHILTIINAAAAWQKWPFITLNTIFLGRHLLLYEKAKTKPPKCPLERGCCETYAC